MNLSDYVGQEIVVSIEGIDKLKLKTVKLLGVEVGGIWIESQELTGLILAAVGLPAANKVIGFFFPYSQISFVMASSEGISLNEKALGL